MNTIQQIKNQVERIRSSIQMNRIQTNSSTKNPMAFNDVVAVKEDPDHMSSDITSKRNDRLDVNMFNIIAEESLARILEWIDEIEETGNTDDIKVIVEYLNDIVRMDIGGLQNIPNTDIITIESSDDLQRLEEVLKDDMRDNIRDSGDLQRLEDVLRDDTECTEQDVQNIKENEYIKQLLESDNEIRNIVKQSKDESIRSFLESNTDIASIVDDDQSFHTVNHSSDSYQSMPYIENNSYVDQEDSTHCKTQNTSDCTTEMIKSILESDEELRNIAYSDKRLKETIEMEIYNKIDVKYPEVAVAKEINSQSEPTNNIETSKITVNSDQISIDKYKDKIINEVIDDLVRSTMEILRMKDESEGTNYQDVFLEYLNDLLEFIVSENWGGSLCSIPTDNFSGISDENTRIVGKPIQIIDKNIKIFDKNKERLMFYLISLKWAMRNYINSISL